LSLFIKNKNKALDREYLLEHIWKDHADTQKRTVNVTINRLKKRLMLKILKIILFLYVG